MSKLQSTLAPVFASPPTATAIGFILSNQPPQGFALFFFPTVNPLLSPAALQGCIHD